MATTVHYRAKLASGVVVDASRDRGAPLTFVAKPAGASRGLSGVIQGMASAVEGLGVGESTEVLVLAGDAHGGRGCPPKVPPHADIALEVEVVAVEQCVTVSHAGGTSAVRRVTPPRLPLERPTPLSTVAISVDGASVEYVVDDGASGDVAPAVRAAVRRMRCGEVCDVDGARVELVAVIRPAPHALDLSPEDQWRDHRYHRDVATERHSSGAFPDAVAHLRRAVSLLEAYLDVAEDSSHAVPPAAEWKAALGDTLASLAVCHSAGGHHGKAVDAASSALRLGPHAKALYRRALAYRASGRLGLFKRDVVEGVRLHPSSAAFRKLYTEAQHRP